MSDTRLSHLTDLQLTTELNRLAHSERAATVALIVHLAEFDARRLYEGAGFQSLFEYCRSVLHLSEDAVYNRIEAARAARQHPEMVGMLLDGRLSLTTARMIGRHLAGANATELLAAASGMGKREVEQLLAERLPLPDVRASVQKVPARSAQGTNKALSPASADPSTLALRASGPAGPSPRADVPTPPPLPPPSRRGRIRPLAPERYEVRFTASASTRAKLREAQDLLGHAVPDGAIAEVVDRALTLLVAHLRKRKWAARSKPAESCVGKETAATQRISAVKREVWTRDGGQCRFVSRDGRACAATRRLEFHHVIPRAASGPFTVENIQLRCRAHNGHEVDVFFGPGIRRRRGDSCHDTRGYADLLRVWSRSGTTRAAAGHGAEPTGTPG